MPRTRRMPSHKSEGHESPRGRGGDASKDVNPADKFVDPSNGRDAVRNSAEIMAQNNHPDYRPGGSKHGARHFEPGSIAADKFGSLVGQAGAMGKDKPGFEDKINSMFTKQASSAMADASFAMTVGKDLHAFTMAKGPASKTKALVQGVKDVVEFGTDKLRNLTGRTTQSSVDYMENGRQSMVNGVQQLQGMGAMNVLTPATWGAISLMDNGTMRNQIGFNPAQMMMMTPTQPGMPMPTGVTMQPGMAMAPGMTQMNGMQSREMMAPFMTQVAGMQANMGELGSYRMPTMAQQFGGAYPGSTANPGEKQGMFKLPGLPGMGDGMGNGKGKLAAELALGAAAVGTVASMAANAGDGKDGVFTKGMKALLPESGDKMLDKMDKSIGEMMPGDAPTRDNGKDSGSSNQQFNQIMDQAQNSAEHQAANKTIDKVTDKATEKLGKEAGEDVAKKAGTEAAEEVGTEVAEKAGVKAAASAGEKGALGAIEKGAMSIGGKLASREGVALASKVPGPVGIAGKVGLGVVTAAPLISEYGGKALDGIEHMFD